MKNLKISNLNRAAGGPLFGLPFEFLKNIASQLSLEKNIIKKYSVVKILAKFEFQKNLRVIEITTIWAKSAEKSIFQRISQKLLKR